MRFGVCQCFQFATQCHAGFDAGDCRSSGVQRFSFWAAIINSQPTVCTLCPRNCHLLSSPPAWPWHRPGLLRLGGMWVADSEISRRCRTQNTPLIGADVRAVRHPASPAAISGHATTSPSCRCAHFETSKGLVRELSVTSSAACCSVSTCPSSLHLSASLGSWFACLRAAPMALAGAEAAALQPACKPWMAAGRCFFWMHHHPAAHSVSGFHLLSHRCRILQHCLLGHWMRVSLKNFSVVTVCKYFNCLRFCPNILQVWFQGRDGRRSH